jgi:hypothetical protein
LLNTFCSNTDNPTCAKHLVDVTENIVDICTLDGTNLACLKGAPSLQVRNDEISTEGGSESPVAGNITVDEVGMSRKRSKKITSCSSNDTWSFDSGLWSVDWLKNIQKGDITLISSKNKRLRKVGKESGVRGGGGTRPQPARRR